MKAAFLVAGALALSTAAPAIANEVMSSEKHRFTVSSVAKGLDNPWGLAFLPGGGMIVTEREGPVRLVSADGKIGEPLTGMPEVRSSGQGGTLDVAIDPNFADNQQIYVSFSEPGDGGVGTAVLRATLNASANALENPRIIFRQFPKSYGGRHFGSRLVFSPDGTLFITTGDRGERDRVQDKKINRGQVIRLNTDGSVPKNNPFAGGGDWRPEVWSMGHRNIQGAALNPATGKLWTHEHGARGGDEINIPQAGKNYGWPIISYGTHYSGDKIGIGTARSGLEQPIYYWDPSIAPSGMAFYTGETFPGWKGSLFVGALRGRMLVRLTLDGDKVVSEERLLTNMGARIRDVRQGPDGAVYLLTDSSNGEILKLTPAS